MLPGEQMAALLFLPLSVSHPYSQKSLQQSLLNTQALNCASSLIFFFLSFGSPQIAWRQLYTFYTYSFLLHIDELKSWIIESQVVI